MSAVDNPDTKDTLQVKEDTLEKNKQELLKYLQKQIDEVDRNVADLAKSFDSLYRRVEDIERDIVPHDKEKDDKDKQILSKTQENLSHLIQNAKNVAGIKVKAIRSLSKLIHFIHADREEICANESLQRCKSLDIDTYMKNERPLSDENGDSLVELLEEQNKRLQEKYKLAREHVKIVSEREKIVHDEREHLRGRLKTLESEIKKCDNDYFAMHEYTDSRGGDVDKWHYVRKDADNGSSSLTYDCDVSTRTKDTQTPYHGSSEHWVQTSDDEETSNDYEDKYQMDDHRITKLQSELQRAKDELKDMGQLLQTVDCLDIYDVTMVHADISRPLRIELELIKRMNEEMDSRLLGLKVKRAHFLYGAVSIKALTREYNHRRWESILDSAAVVSKRFMKDTNKMIFVVLYEYSDEKEVEVAIAKKCEILDKFIVITLQHSHGDLFPNADTSKGISQIINTITEYGTRKREVVKCSNCKK